MTIVFPVRVESGEIVEVLMSMKKRGFGEGYWNGLGGKFNPELDSSVEDTPVRESEEEARIKITRLEKVGTLDFAFPSNPDWDQKARISLAYEW